MTLALSFDEESGCLGAVSLARHLLAKHPKPAVVIVGESTSLRVVRTHKGVRMLRTSITGRDVHSSRPDLGASAVTAAARILNHIGIVAENLAATGLTARGFEPPHSTVNVGTIAGGEAVNIVPRACGFDWEYRCIPGEGVDAIQRHVYTFVADNVLPRLRRQAPEATLETEVLADVPPLSWVHRSRSRRDAHMLVSHRGDV